MPISEGLEAAIANLAKVTVERNLDPGRVVHALVEMVRFKNEVWPTLTPEQRYALRVRLRHARKEAERRVAELRQPVQR